MRFRAGRGALGPGGGRWRLLPPAVALTLGLILAACSGGGSGRSGSAVGTPVAPGGTAVYLSLGDSIQAGCCGSPDAASGELFRQYLSHTLRRRVDWVNMAAAGTSEGFLQDQLPKAEAMLRGLRGQGQDVVAITFDIGRDDFVALKDPATGQPCTSALTEACGRLIDRATEHLRANYEAILPRLVAARDPNTPVLVLDYYDPWDTGDSSEQVTALEGKLADMNTLVREEAAKFGLTLVDVYPRFKGHAGELVTGVDPTDEGHRVIAAAYQEAWESLPQAVRDAHRLQAAGVAQDTTPAPAGAGFPLLVPSSLPAGVTLGPAQFATTDSGIPVAHISGQAADGSEAVVIDEQALVHGDGSGPDLGSGDTIRGRPATIVEGPPRIISWVESSLWLTVRSETLPLDDLKALVESMQLQ